METQSVGNVNSQLYSLLSQKSIDGSVKGASLEDITKQKYSATSQEAKAFLKLLESNFDKIDGDKNGNLTVKEVNTYLKNQLGTSQDIIKDASSTASSTSTKGCTLGKSTSTQTPNILGGLMSLASNEQVRSTIGSAVSKAASAYGSPIAAKISSSIGIH